MHATTSTQKQLEVYLDQLRKDWEQFRSVDTLLTALGHAQRFKIPLPAWLHTVIYDAIFRVNADPRLTLDQALGLLPKNKMKPVRNCIRRHLGMLMAEAEAVGFKGVDLWRLAKGEVRALSISALDGSEETKVLKSIKTKAALQKILRQYKDGEFRASPVRVHPSFFNGYCSVVYSLFLPGPGKKSVSPDGIWNRFFAKNNERLEQLLRTRLGVFLENLPDGELLRRLDSASKSHAKSLIQS